MQGFELCRGQIMLRIHDALIAQLATAARGLMRLRQPAEGNAANAGIGKSDTVF